MEVNKLYEIVLNYKSQMETRRDEMNKYYTSLFAALISFMPFIDNITGHVNTTSKGYNIRYILMLLSILGFILSISWRQSLSRIYNYLKGSDELLSKIETDFQIGYISYMFTYLNKTNSPGQVTKHQMLVPDTFIAIFCIIFIYSVSWCIF